VTTRRSDARVTAWTAVAFVAWFAAVVTAGVLGARLDNGWFTLLALVLLFGGWVALGLLDWGSV
jgi:hypothetical protein